MEGTGQSPTESPRWKRVLLKLSGEILAGDLRTGLDPETVTSVCRQILDVSRTGVQLALVVGGGNFLRGADLTARGMDRSAADQIGMLATVMNSLALQDRLEGMGAQTRVLSALKIEQVAEPYIRRRARRHLEKGRIIILAGGTGNPYFSTDTAAVLRAVETGCEVVLKATKVDGVFTSDPVRDSSARLLPRLTHAAVLEQNLRVMDLTAITLAKENRLPIAVFNLHPAGNLARVLRGEPVGTLVEEDPTP